jgi:hypothetical protein
VIQHAVRHRDRGLLQGLLQNMGAWQAARGGSDDLIRSTMLKIEREQEQSHLIDSHTLEVRAARREFAATKLEAEDAWRAAALTTAPDALRRATRQGLEDAYRAGDAERVRQGEEPVA